MNNKEQKIKYTHKSLIAFSEESQAKPRLVFFQWNHRGLPKFLQLHMQLHVKCLASFFDVTVISKDCDYRQVCDEYHPDITLFESSSYNPGLSKKIAIKNTSVYPEIPKLGLHNADGWCGARSGFISDMEHWGVETFFSICISTLEHTPAIADQLFVWPNFIDDNLYRDYGERKTIPLLLTGQKGGLYQWREEIFKVVSNNFPHATLPHSGYESSSPQMIYGENYARAINASWFVPACGTVAKDIIRKQFEIPGSKSCLITERTPSVEAAGFADMKNCVFANEGDVLDKINFLINNPEKLADITNAGYNLVHTRHTLKQRDQIFQWFLLNKRLKPKEKIIQSNPFEPLQVVRKMAVCYDKPIVCDGIHLRILKEANQKLQEGDFTCAEKLFLSCLRYISWMAEPKFGLSLCYLSTGRPGKAMELLSDLIQTSLAFYKAADPDPVAWAYLIICIVAKGRLNEATVRASQFPSLAHPELDRARLIVQYLVDQDKAKVFAQDNVSTKYRRSVHQLPAVAFEQWVNNVIVIFRACNQQEYAASLSTLFAPPGISLRNNKQISFNRYLIKAWAYSTDWMNGVFKTLRIPEIESCPPSIFLSDYIVRIARHLKLNRVIRYLRGLRHTFRSIRWSVREKTKENGSANPIHHIFETAHPRTILLVGSSAINCFRKTFTQKKPQETSAKFIYLDFNVSNKQFPFSPLMSFQFAPAFLSSFSTDLNEYIKKVKEENRIDQFDVVCLDSTWLFQNEPLEELEHSRFLILNGVCAENNSKQAFINKHNYQLVSQQLSDENGYTIFKNNQVAALPLVPSDL